MSSRAYEAAVAKERPAEGNKFNVPVIGGHLTVTKFQNFLMLSTASIFISSCHIPPIYSEHQNTIMTFKSIFIVFAAIAMSCAANEQRAQITRYTQKSITEAADAFNVRNFEHV